MKKPNFFILGAPKCGTTSLAAWLAEHPNVFMSPVKEPDFFNTDMSKPHSFSRKEYEHLFAKANSQHTRIGEASSNYLYSQDAVPNLLNYVENPSEVKHIVAIRNPVDMVVSWHGEMLRNGNEVVKDFATAWHLQETRANGLSLPKFSEQTSLVYGPFCLLGEQLKRLFRELDRKQVHILVLDDLKANSRLEYTKILGFLGLPDDGRQQFPVYNPARTLPYWAARLTLLVNWAKGILGVKRGFGLIQELNRKLNKPKKQDPIGVEIQMELKEYYKEDIALLGEILERDFSNWLEPKLIKL